ncbi:PREDICTED: mitochondrial inner membrane protein COX18-like [Priapulus caudatus]|uniref:Mitochondrial inner membrane protein COX18-like n=1 Tax=Priapulus caudatus TaxID=37621 RepID=A0ABM1EGC9_PRICU|nr:PREDICTED: mitochondrial inner membrane protein COX18-like [Priapulus caudatus]
MFTDAGTSMPADFTDKTCVHILGILPGLCSGSYSTECVMQSIHDTSGLPWWASIVVTTCLLRSAITLPLAIYQAHILAKVEGLQPEIKTIAEGLKKEVSVAKKMYKWGEKTTRLQFKINIRRRPRRTAVRERQLRPTPRNASACTSVLNMFWCFAVPQPVLSSFAVPQPVLSVLTCSVFCSASACTISSDMFCVLQCLSLYWVSSSTFGLAQNVALKFPSVRRACRIPPAPSESQTPFRDMVAHFRARRARADASTKDTSASTKDTSAST